MKTFALLAILALPVQAAPNMEIPMKVIITNQQVAYYYTEPGEMCWVSHGSLRCVSW